MFSDRLKQIRKMKGLTQNDLAKALDVSSWTVALWESGKRMPEHEMIERLSGVFGIRKEHLLASRGLPSVKDRSEGGTEIDSPDDLEEILDSVPRLDDYGQRAVADLLRSEMRRCEEQGTLKDAPDASSTVLAERRRSRLRPREDEEDPQIKIE